MSLPPLIFFHDGLSDFPHGAGPSELGWYSYPAGVIAPEPLGPFPSPWEASGFSLSLSVTELVALAERFYTEAEAASIADVRRVFQALATQDEPTLRAILKEFGIT